VPPGAAVCSAVGVAYRLLAQAVLALHMAFTGYVLLGGFLAWRWPRALWPHLAAVCWAALGLAVRLFCPLTAWQNALRRRGGLPELPHGFIGTYLVGPVVPAGWVPAARVAVGVLVAVSWLGVLRIRQQRQRGAGGIAGDRGVRAR
jgi:hypothetical protein